MKTRQLTRGDLLGFTIISLRDKEYCTTDRTRTLTRTDQEREAPFQRAKITERIKESFERRQQLSAVIHSDRIHYFDNFRQWNRNQGVHTP